MICQAPVHILSSGNSSHPPKPGVWGMRCAKHPSLLRSSCRVLPAISRSSKIRASTTVSAMNFPVPCVASIYCMEPLASWPSLMLCRFAGGRKLIPVAIGVYTSNPVVGEAMFQQRRISACLETFEGNLDTRSPDAKNAWAWPHSSVEK